MLSYDQNTILKMVDWTSAMLNLSEFTLSEFASVHQISSKSGNYVSLTYGALKIQNVGRTQYGIYEICSLCLVTFPSMPFCFTLQNLLKSDNRLQSYIEKKTIFNMAAVRHLALGSFCHAVFVGMICCFLVQNFAEIGQSCMLRRLISCCIITFNKRSK